MKLPTEPVAAGTPFSPMLFQRQLRALAGQQAPSEGDWLPWMAVIEVAIAQPEAFRTAVRALSLDDRFGLLAMAASPLVPPLADHLLALLATHLGEEEDPQLRHDIAQAYQTAQQLARERLCALQQRLDRTAATADTREYAMKSGEVTTLIAAQEARLAELRTQSAESSAYAKMYAGEAEALRLETQRAAVAQYDFATREAYRDQLRATVQQEGARRNELETQIREQADALAAMSERLHPLHERSETAARERAESEAEVARLQDEITRWEEERPVLDIELAALTRQASQSAEARHELVHRIERLRNEARQLHEDLEGITAGQKLIPQVDQIEASLQTIYDTLPRDEADPLFTRRK